jgi:hypothetical protein
LLKLFEQQTVCYLSLGRNFARLNMPLDATFELRRRQFLARRNQSPYCPATHGRPAGRHKGHEANWDAYTLHRAKHHAPPPPPPPPPLPELVQPKGPTWHGRGENKMAALMVFQKPQEAGHDDGKSRTHRATSTNNVIWAIQEHDLFLACHPDKEHGGASRITHVGSVLGTETAAGPYSWPNVKGRTTKYKNSMRVDYGELARLPEGMEYYFAARIWPEQTVEERRTTYATTHGLNPESVLVPQDRRSLQIHVTNESGILLGLDCLPKPLLCEVQRLVAARAE